MAAPVMRATMCFRGPPTLVCDFLTGNVLIKMLSSFTTGGSFESTGGYGPGIGRDYDKLVLIISRAWRPLIANAPSFADELVRGGVQKIAKAEFALADKAGLEELLRQKRGGFRSGGSQGRGEGPAKGPHRRHPRHRGHGHRGCRAGAGPGYLCRVAMGCTGPLVLVSDANEERAKTCCGGRLHRLRL